MAFKGAMGVYERICRFNSKLVRTKKKCVAVLMNVRTDVIISQKPGLKTAVRNDIFGVKQGQDLENQAAHPHQEFPVPPGVSRKGVFN